MVDATYIVPIIIFLAFFAIRQVQAHNRAFVDVPAVGSWGYIGAFKYIVSAKSVLEEGYHKYKNQLFKVATPGRWIVILSGPKLIEELRKAPDEELSMIDALDEFLQIPYTLGPNISRNPYHVDIVRSELTRNLAVLFDAIRDEIECAFDEILNLQDEEWHKFPATETVLQIVSRTSNRVFVGLPLCRDPDYIKLSIRFTMDVVVGSGIINLFPRFLRPLAGRFLTTVPRSVRRGLEHYGPIIAERQKYMEEYGKEWSDKPNDMLTWLMEEAQGEEKTPMNLTKRLLTLNFAAIHTSSMSFIHALYHLAANPEYAVPMRDEVESILKEEGWSKASLGKMRKVDSFLRESLRLDGLGIASMMRKAMKPYTFSDGTVLPAGTLVYVASGPIQQDDDVYADARAFKPFRFAELRENAGEGVKHQAVSTGVDFTTFGHGRHACPGRFFAANELKTMLVHVILNYDVKFENEGVRPENKSFGAANIPDPKAEIMVRRRQR